MGDHADAGNGLIGAHAHHQHDLPGKAGSGGHLHRPALDGRGSLGGIDGLDDAGAVVGFGHARGTGKDFRQCLLGLEELVFRDPVGGDFVHVGQGTGHDAGDQQQRHRKPENVQGSILCFHLFSPPFFLGAPNLVGRPIRSSSTTQQFITRMA